jgi:hypothetical protein
MPASVGQANEVLQILGWSEGTPLSNTRSSIIRRDKSSLNRRDKVGSMKVDCMTACRRVWVERP